MAFEPRRICETCGAGLDAAQRYCLSCGSRAGSPDPQLAELKRRAVTEPIEHAPMPAPVLASASPPRGLAPRLPGPGMACVLVLVFLGFGALLGSAAGSTRDRLAAEVSPRLKLMVPAEAPATSTNEASAATEAPASEPEETPEPAAEGSASTATKTSAEGKASTGESQSKSESTAKSKSTTDGPATKLPALKHVFLIVLDDEPYAAIFGPESKAHYVAGTLEKKGELLLRYDAVAHEQLANGIALVSGQGPTTQTEANCPAYSALAPTGTGADGQVLGEGCVYPSGTETVGGQLAAKKLKWRAYVQGIDEPGSSAGACAHPGAGAAYGTFESGTYATFRDPFVYFESVTSSPSCATDVVGLSALKGDLADASNTPSLSYIVPDRCDDASPAPCSPGAAAGPADADGLLESVVSEIMASKSFEAGGLIVITSDEAPSSGEFEDSSSCCGQPAYPNLPAQTGRSKGGGAVGALLISPYVRAGKTSSEEYNHFSLLRTIEEVFGLGHLGYAGLNAVKPLSPGLFLEKAKG